jgi:hypothetical protein
MLEIKEAPSKYEAIEKATIVVQNWYANTDKALVKLTTNLSSESEIKTFVLPFVDALSSKWSKYFVSYRPAPVLEKVAVPVLAMNGANDIQVPAEMNLNGIKEALKAGKSKNFTIRGFAGMNHLFQKCKICNVGEYGHLETTIEPEVLDFMKEWLEKLLK